MQSGLLMGYQLDWLVPRFLSLYFLINLCLAAPGLPGTQREESAGAHSPSAGLINPFGSGEEERRLLQSYIQHSLQSSQGGPEITSWEQALVLTVHVQGVKPLLDNCQVSSIPLDFKGVFFLFRLFDYDRSGFLDGLEMMKLLSDYNSNHALGPETSEQVELMVDFLLQTQDLNQDGLLDPSELLSPPFINTQGSSGNKTPHQEQELAEENMLSNTMTVEEHAAVPHREEQQHDTMTLKEEPVKQTEEHQDQELFNALAEEQEQAHHVPVHQGQPEI